MKVIYLMADTFRRDHLGAYGNDWIHTPYLDRLAEESVLFENAYIGSFPTVPNRRDTLLGQGDQGLPFNRWKALEPDEVTFPLRLAEKKIPSQLITDTQNNVTKTINLYRDYTAWTLNRGQEGDPHWLDDGVPLEFPVPPELIRYRAEWWHQILMNRAHRRVETDWFAPGTYELAIQWLERNYTRKDFFLWVDTFDPHEPWDPPQYYIDLYDPGYKGRVFEAPTYGLRKEMGITDAELKQIRARYAGEVTMVDTCVGRLLAALEKLDILDDTLLIFTSDHGTQFDYPGEGGLLQKANTLGADGMCMSAGRPMKKPLRYFPLYPSVARVPLLLRLPGTGRKQRVGALVQPWDLTATILDAFGINRPKEFLGESLLSVIEGRTTKIRDAVIVGNNTLAQAMTPRWIYTVWRNGVASPVLLDRKNDPLLKKDVRADHPAVVKRLHRQIVAFMERQGIVEDFIAGYEG